MKPLTTEPPLDPPVTREDEIEWRRYELHKQGLLDEEQLNDALLENPLQYIQDVFIEANEELELEHQWMQSLDDEACYENI